MQKKELTSTYLYYGDVKMPKGFEINPKPLIMGTFEQEYLEKRFPFSRDLDKVDTYIRNYAIAKHKLPLEGKETWGNFYLPQECSQLKKHKYNFTVLYGTQIQENSCNITIFYEQDKEWTIQLITNKFIMFPSDKTYRVNSNKSNKINFIQSMIYELK
tara:strand:- start:1611 stop:2084 length:474 start_codon:yes stop_codon:yes gene_type:complete